MLRFVAAFIINTVDVRHRNIKFDMSSAFCGVFQIPNDKISFLLESLFVSSSFSSSLGVRGIIKNVLNLQVGWPAPEPSHSSDNQGTYIVYLV